MKRDMEFVREVLFAIERNKAMDGTVWFRFDDPSELGLTDCSLRQLGYTLELLSQAGFIDAKSDMQIPLVSGLTWEGHEFLDTVRDPEIWRKTNERIRSVESVGVNFIIEIARAEIKVKLGLL